jgi:hypothetical protein
MYAPNTRRLASDLAGIRSAGSLRIREKYREKPKISSET